MLIQLLFLFFSLAFTFLFAGGLGYNVGKADAINENAAMLKRARNLVASARRANNDL
jgi:hypothetical protein